MSINAELRALVAKTQPGATQTYRGINLVPLIAPPNGGPVYITLDEAFSQKQLAVTEISQGGSVPNLKVINQAAQPVLLIDGEELVGAKQNRVLNTSILLKETSETVIPVSCTEQGRWRYDSPAFAPSPIVMSHKARTRKSSSVSAFLAMQAEYFSDQGEVWAEIAEHHLKAGTQSPTGAMHDAYLQRRAELDDACKTFVPVAGQTGLMILIDGEPAGFDIVSRPEAYARLHQKLLNSYLMDALLDTHGQPLDAAAAAAKSREFLAEILSCEESQFPSLGYGTDCRYQKPGLVGTALIHEHTPVHSAFFRIQGPGGSSPMSSLRRRRGRHME